MVVCGRIGLNRSAATSSPDRNSGRPKRFSVAWHPPLIEFCRNRASRESCEQAVQRRNATTLDSANDNPTSGQSDDGSADGTLKTPAGLQ
jgi:hypothetical protein